MTINKLLSPPPPLYIKTNSYGEFVFDWSWASAYEQSWLSYYPKLIASIPYTPVTGTRLLIAPNLTSDLKNSLAVDMIKFTIEEAKKLNMSSMHWLFNQADECKFFKQQDLMLRLGCQYHCKTKITPALIIF